MSLYPRSHHLLPLDLEKRYQRTRRLRNWATVGLIAVFTTAIGAFIGMDVILVGRALEEWITVPSRLGPLEVWTNMLGGAIAGVTMGYLMVFHIRRWFRTTHSLWAGLFLELTVIGMVLAIKTLVTFMVHDSYVEAGLSQPGLSPWQLFTHQLTEPYTLFLALNYGLFIWLVFYILEAAERLGPGQALDLLMGRYFRPVENERIFMFVDLKGSTSIAERLGHIMYHHFLDDYFSDLSGAIVHTGGCVYQYAGDEIVVSWAMKRGLKQSNCLMCFFQAERLIIQRRDYYLNRYGVVPEFRAGLHYGLVTTGAVGRYRRDIVHSGDVLNTTARLMSLAADRGLGLVISKVLYQKLGAASIFKLIKLGKVDLRGRQEQIDVLGYSPLSPDLGTQKQMPNKAQAS